MDSLSFLFLLGTKYLCFRPGARIQRPKANELYHRVAIAADRVFEYVEAMENTPLLRARGLDNKFHLLADFGGAVLAGRERGTGRGYEFVTWIWDYERVGVSHGHYSIERHTRTLDEKDIRNGKVLYSDLDTDELLGEDILRWTRPRMRCWER